MLDFVPGSHQYLLTILAVWWSLGQLFCSLVSARRVFDTICQQAICRSHGL